LPTANASAGERFAACHGCWSEMCGGEGVHDAIRCFGERGRLFYIHLRDVVGKADNFTEMFLDDGNVNPVTTVKTLEEVGFRSPLSSRARRSLPLRWQSTPSARKRLATGGLRRGSPRR
jgi:D-mannonate dehydratase